MQWIVRIGAGLLLALGVVATAFAATPDGKTAATALPLPASLSATGSVNGSRAGSFVYYTFNYPGDDSVGKVALDVSPANHTVENATGVNVYQNGNTLATMNTVSPTPGTNSVTFSSSTKGAVLVQVYNYNQDVTVAYHLAVSGVTATAPSPSMVTATTPPPVPVATETVESPTMPRQLTTPVSGTLAGNAAGSFVQYLVDSPGDGSVQTVRLVFSPRGVNVGNAIILSAYQNGETLGTIDGSHGTAPGDLSLSFSSTTKGPVLIQIGNYNPSPTISYTISVSG